MKNKSLIKWGIIPAAVGIISISSYFCSREQKYTKPFEIITEVVQERKENSQLEEKIKKRIQFLNENRTNSKILDDLFLYECDNLSQEKKEQYIREILKQKPVLEFKYLSREDNNLRIGLTVNGEPTYLYGTSLENLHFKCDYGF